MRKLAVFGILAGAGLAVASAYLMFNRRGRKGKSGPVKLQSVEVGKPQSPFDKAVALVSAGKLKKLSTDERLKLYGLYKRATVGPCDTARPKLDIVAGAKWDAWKAVSNMSTDEAIAEYVKFVLSLSNTAASLDLRDDSDSSDSEDDDAGADMSSFGARFSSSFTFADDRTAPTAAGAATASAAAADLEMGTPASFAAGRALGDFAAGGDLNGIQRMLVGGADPNAQDEYGQTALMRAADRGYGEIVAALLQHGAAVSVADSDGMTALHYAAVCGQEACVRLLVRAGADPDQQDLSGETPRTSSAEIAEVIADEEKQLKKSS